MFSLQFLDTCALFKGVRQRELTNFKSNKLKAFIKPSTHTHLTIWPGHCIIGTRGINFNAISYPMTTNQSAFKARAHNLKMYFLALWAALLACPYHN